MATQSHSSPAGPAIESQAFRIRSFALGLGGAFLTAACFARFGLEPEALVGSLFAVVLLALAVIDLERRIVPNRIVLPATAVILVAQVAFSPDRALEWVLASVGAALFLLLPLLVYPKGMGMGDVKLALLLGAGLGLSVVPALVVGLLAGFVGAVIVLVVRGPAARKLAMPFVPFLAFGGLVALFFN